MIQHSAIIENFLRNPKKTRKDILDIPMKDHLASDNVIYPGIVEPSEIITDELNDSFTQLYGSKFDPVLMFARHSFESMKPPHWAHSDLNMAQYVGLIYLSPVDYPWDGTHCVKHKKSRLEIHPRSQDEIDIVMGDSNDKEKWDITYTCPSRFNRLFVLDARYLHAAAYKFGDRRDNSRLVLSVFFNLR